MASCGMQQQQQLLLLPLYTMDLPAAAGLAREGRNQHVNPWSSRLVL
ncbi:MAG: hypothetical protein ACRDNW_04240 [Trebonia sp.]